MTIAEKIIEQLGGNKFIAMTGAITTSSKDGRLEVKFKGSEKATIVIIELTKCDTYKMTFYKHRGIYVRTITTIENVFAGDLRSVFTQVTGLYTSL